MEARSGDVETFVGITGASEAVAARMLEEAGGDLNAAINTFFNTSDPQGPPFQPGEPDYMDEDQPQVPPEPVPVVRTGWGIPNLPNFDPIRTFFGIGGDRTAPAPELAAPFVTEPRDVRQVPIVWRDPPAAPPAPRINIEDVTGDDTLPQGVTGGIVHVDDDDSPTRPVGVPYPRRSPEHEHFPVDVPSVPAVEYDVEEEMVQAAIEASRRDAEIQDPVAAAAAAQAVGNEDDDIARAMSLSIQTAEEEKRLRDLTGEGEDGTAVLTETVARRQNPPSSSVGPRIGPNVYEEEQPLVRRRSRRLEQVAAATAAAAPTEDPINNAEHTPSAPRGHDEWGGITSEEQDEAMMLEAALFGAINPIPWTDVPRAPQTLPPAVVEHRIIREQQDDEYLASLAADREKELKAQQEAEVASKKEKQRREDEQRQSRAAEELERKLAAKAETLPPEPAQEDDSAVTILVRLPDGSRHGRRFRKSDKLQSLFDFIDVKRVVKPGTYRLVRQYPRRMFSAEEHDASFDSLGLTSKQEALFLESA